MKSLLILGVLLCVALCVRSAAIETLEAAEENIQPYVSVEAEPEVELAIPQEDQTAVIEEQQETGRQAKRVKFGQLCSGNPRNSRRPKDPHGYGHYNAPREDGKFHKGLDIVCRDGATVYAPFDVTLHGRLTVYTDPEGKEAINEGINLRGKGLCFKLFYVRPYKTSGSVKKGQRIGTMLPMQSVYPRITSHVHVQMCDRSDPTRYF